MDRFKNSNENPDFYFSNSEGAQANAPVKRSAPHNAKRKKKSSGVGSTYLFFIIVICVSVVVSIYAILCMNDLFAITKTKSKITNQTTTDSNDVEFSCQQGKQTSRNKK